MRVRLGSPLWADPLLRFAGLLCGSGVLWYAALVARPQLPAIISWAMCPVCAAVAAIASWRSGSDGRVPLAARRFWRHAGAALAVFSIALLFHGVESLNSDGTVTSRLSPVSAFAQGLGLLMLVWPLLRLPLGVRTSAQRASLWLDVAALTLSAATFIWHFSVRSALSDTAHSSTQTNAAVALMVVVITGAFLVAKVGLTGSASLDRGALWLLGGALIWGGLGSAMAVQLSDRSDLDASLIIVPVGCFMIAVGARRQTFSGGVGGAGSAVPRRRRYSIIPYIAVAATDALMVAAVFDDDSDIALLSVVAVILTGLVIARQLIALAENNNLLGRLDAGMIALGQQEKRFRLLVQNATDVVTISDPQGTLAYISPGVQRVLGHDPGVLLVEGLSRLVHPDDAATVAEDIARVLDRPAEYSCYQVRLAHADGSWRWLEVTSRNLLDEPAIGGIVSNARDITDTKVAQERLSYEATHDSLTGLPNRTLFNDCVRASAGKDERFSVVLVDLDDFKGVNDTLGHAAGDALLVHVATTMQEGLRSGDTVARLGGDEFAVLIRDLRPEGVDAVLARIAGTLRRPVVIDGHMLAVRASFGVSEGGHGEEPSDLLRRADIAMYEAKASGGGGHRRYETGMRVRGTQEQAMASALGEALERGQFELYYQPIVQLSDGRIAGVEALLRWHHPQRGLITPENFIGAAERTDLIIPVGRWVLYEAVRQASVWQATSREHDLASISVNVSASQLRDSAFATDVADALALHGLPADRLTLEITESTAVGGGATQEILHHLRTIGVRLSLDDFGTGASTLSLLTECPVDQIKLDRSFTPSLRSDTMARAVRHLARMFGTDIVAEGVESKQQADMLGALGYRKAQGAYFAAPMTGADLTKWPAHSHANGSVKRES